MGLSRFPIPNRSIVITTINPPTSAVTAFIEIARQKGWNLVVVGDRKTPGEIYLALQEVGLLTYLTPDRQDALFPELSAAIGWNTSIRRNIGYAYVYKYLKSSLLATVDDDNIPNSDWGEDVYVGKETSVHLYRTNAPVADPLKLALDASKPPLWHRGFPIELVANRSLKYIDTVTITPDVQASLWDGEPDVDAIERLIFPNIDKLILEPLHPFTFSCFSPFNSQNTFLSRRAMREFLLLPDVGRVDDIWGAYRLQKTNPDIKIVYTRATVYQDRNPHDLMEDFRNEIFGYTHILDYILGKSDIPSRAKSLVDIYQRSLDNGYAQPGVVR